MQVLGGYSPPSSPCSTTLVLGVSQTIWLLPLLDNHCILGTYKSCTEGLDCIPVWLNCIAVWLVNVTCFSLYQRVKPIPITLNRFGDQQLAHRTIVYSEYHSDYYTQVLALYTLKYIHSNARYHVCYEEVDIRSNCTFRVDLHYINCFHDVRSKLHSVVTTTALR